MEWKFFFVASKILMRNKCKQFDQYAFAAIELSGTKKNIKEMLVC